MHEYKHGTLKSGSGKKVTSKKQALAIGMSEMPDKKMKAKHSKVWNKFKKSKGMK